LNGWDDGQFARGKLAVKKSGITAFAVRQSFCITQYLDTVNYLYSLCKSIGGNSLQTNVIWHNPRFRVGHN
jgi:hypothetical protein